jgi:hypothetical protein
MMVAVGLLAGCTATSPPTAQPSSSSGGPAGVGSAWQSILDQIQPDGTVSTQTALQAFALTFGPLPGVTVPADTGGGPSSGTGPLRWLVQHWSEITVEQRSAAAAFVPELAGLPTTAPTPTALPTQTVTGPPTTTAPVPPTTAASPVSRSVPGPVSRDEPVALRSPNHSNAVYTQVANQQAQDLGARVGHTLSIPIQAQVSPQPANDDAATTVLSSSGGTVGTPGKCIITIFPHGDKLVGDNFGELIAHEVWHCFEGDIGGLARFWNGPDWILEGGAAWVAFTLYPNAPIDEGFWPPYLVDPGKSLFQRAYDAVGFYSQLTQSGVNVWSKLVPILLANGDPASFAAAGANQDPFFQLWASGYARLPGRGSAWDIVGPGVSADLAKPVALAVPDAVSVPVSAPAYANAIYSISDGSAEVLEITGLTHGRISDGSGHDYLIETDGTFCHRPAGCTCPNQNLSSPPPVDLPGTDILLAVSGATGGASGAVTGSSLTKYCHTLTGQWRTEWFNDNGLALGAATIELIQKNGRISGSGTVSGKTCMTAVTVTGTVIGSAVHVVVHGERDITMDGQISGNTMSGRFSANSCGPPYGPPTSVIVTGTWTSTKLP